MGQNYSIDLFFKSADLEAALLATAAIASPLGEPILVRLPSGRELSLPFTVDNKNEGCEVRVGELGVCFDTVLRFSIDEELVDFIDDSRGHFGSRLDTDSVEVGMISLFVHLSDQYVELSFKAVTSSMSYLFRRSQSIHSRLLTLLNQASGVAGIIDVESDDGDYFLLSDPAKAVRLDRRKFLDDDFDPRNGGTDYDVDGFTTALLIECDRLGGA